MQHSGTLDAAFKNHKHAHPPAHFRQPRTNQHTIHECNMSATCTPEPLESMQSALYFSDNSSGCSRTGCILVNIINERKKL
jgi:hypothetical protein